ncbi:MAG: hypothetical protein SGI74_08705 [Oligoflexia bacterium]|nr:hypothetical protein [Oligoflexia bacterium]
MNSLNDEMLERQKNGLKCSSSFLGKLSEESADTSCKPNSITDSSSIYSPRFECQLRQSAIFSVGQNPPVSYAKEYCERQSTNTIVADYYYYMNRINQGELRTVDEIATLDIALGIKPLRGIKSNISPDNPQLEARINKYANDSSCNNNHRKELMNSFVKQTKQALEKLQHNERVREKLRNTKVSYKEKGSINANALDAQTAEKLNDSDRAILSVVPWVVGRSFDSLRKKDLTSYASEALLNEVLLNATSTELNIEREKLARRVFHDYRQAKSCLNEKPGTPSGDCAGIDTFSNTLASTPDVNLSDLDKLSSAGGDIRDHMKYSACKSGKLNAKRERKQSIKTIGVAVGMSAFTVASGFVAGPVGVSLTLANLGLGAYAANEIGKNYAKCDSLNRNFDLQIKGVSSVGCSSKSLELYRSMNESRNCILEAAGEFALIAAPLAVQTAGGLGNALKVSNIKAPVAPLNPAVADDAVNAARLSVNNVPEELVQIARANKSSTPSMPLAGRRYTDESGVIYTLEKGLYPGSHRMSGPNGIVIPPGGKVPGAFKLIPANLDKVRIYNRSNKLVGEGYLDGVDQNGNTLLRQIPPLSGESNVGGIYSRVVIEPGYRIKIVEPYVSPKKLTEAEIKFQKTLAELKLNDEAAAKANAAKIRPAKNIDSSDAPGKPGTFVRGPGERTRVEYTDNQKQIADDLAAAMRKSDGPVTEGVSGNAHVFEAASYVLPDGTVVNGMYNGRVLYTGTKMPIFSIGGKQIPYDKISAPVKSLGKTFQRIEISVGETVLIPNPKGQGYIRGVYTGSDRGDAVIKYTGENGKEIFKAIAFPKLALPPVPLPPF